MKKVIRYLADYYGISEDIREKAKNDIGAMLYEDGYWFVRITPVRNILQSMGECLKKGYYWDIKEIRDKFYEDIKQHDLNIKK